MLRGNKRINEELAVVQEEVLKRKIYDHAPPPLFRERAFRFDDGADVNSVDYVVTVSCTPKTLQPH